MAGTITKYSDSCFSAYNSISWIIDLGASQHMCFNSGSFLDLLPLSALVTINLPNSYRIQVTHTGRIAVSPGFILQNVLFVPSFRYNRLSVHRFCGKFTCSLLFNLERCVMQDLSMKKE